MSDSIMHILDKAHSAEMVTSNEEVIVGRVLWHVYGHLLIGPTERIIVRAPVSGTEMHRLMGQSWTPLSGDEIVQWFEYTYGDNASSKHNYPIWAALGDCGIGSKHNYNRLFKTKAAAEAYLKDCGKFSVHLF